MEDSGFARILARPHNRSFGLTADHLDMLGRVRDGAIMWRSDVGLSGGFSPADGSRFPPSDALVVLYELRNAGLIGVEMDGGRVLLTVAGKARLNQKSAREPSTG